MTRCCRGVPVAARAAGVLWPLVQAGDFYRYLLLGWLVYGVLLFLVQNLMFGDRLRKAREARLAAEALSASLCEQNRRTEEEAATIP